MRSLTWKKTLAGVMSAWCCLTWMSPVGFAQTVTKDVVDTRTEDELFLYRGDLASLKVYSLTRVAVSTPGVVDIVSTDINEILLAGKQTGETQFFIWDEYGKRTVMIRVLEKDLELVQRRIMKLLRSSEIDGVVLEQNPLEGKIVATGRVNRSQKERFDAVVEPFSEYIINMVDEQGDLIQIDAQITELNKTLNEIMGVDWAQTFSVAEAVPSFDGSFFDVFKIGDFSRTTQISAIVNYLLDTSQARNLSRPSIVVVDGESASVLVGGELPIMTTNANDGNLTENIEYKEYGVDLEITPTLQDDGKIEITMNVTVRDIDSTNSTDEASAFSTTTAQTKVLLDDRQTIILAGLIKKAEVVAESKIPFLSSIPIIGLLFRNKNFNQTVDKEIVISLTPTILKQKTKEKYLSRGAASLPGTAGVVQSSANKDGGNNSKAGLALKEDTGLQPLDEGFDADSADALLDDSASAAEPDMASGRDTADASEASEASGASAGETFERYMGMEAPDEGAGAVDDEASIISAYAQTVQNRIAAKIAFPYEAVEQGWEGTVVLTLTILSDGTLNRVDLQESSGHAVFDRDALNTAEILSPFDPFPFALDRDEIEITVPVVYRQSI